MNLDLSHLLDVFLAEANEYVQSLEVALVALERSDGSDTAEPEVLDEAFRVAHSLKGMCGMMGFDRMAALTHAMEESLLQVRERGARMDEQRLDTLLACVAGLEDALGAVASSRGEPDVLDDLTRRIAGVEATVAAPSPSLIRDPGAAIPTASLDDTTEVRVTLSPRTELPGVRAFVVLRALRRLGGLIASDPQDPASFDGLEVRAWMRDIDAAAVRAEVSQIPEVDSVEVAGADDAAGDVEHVGRSLARPRARAEATLRVASSRLDELMFRMQEVVVSATRLEQLIDAEGADELRAALAHLSRDARELQASMMHVRMTSLDTAFARIPRLVRDLARRLGRVVALEVSGAETEVDRSMVDALADPLVHLIRNAIDHGIEPPDERVAAGKPAGSILSVSARHAAGHVVIEVCDDGRGIDRDAVVAAAVEQGRISSRDIERFATDSELQELLCAPAVSTARDVTEISGRGVGLDAVSATVRRLGGRLEIVSRRGHGTTIRLQLPTTLAIMPVLLVRAGDSLLAVPVDRVANVRQHDPRMVRDVPGGRLITRDGKPTLALHDLGVALGHEQIEDAAARYVVSVQTLDADIALGVDELLGTLDVATRPLPAAYSDGLTPLLGVGMLPDGGLAPIIDCDAIARAAGAEATA